MFNFAKRKNKYIKPQEKQLIGYNDENDFYPVENPPSLHGLIKEKHKEDDCQRITESQFERENNQENSTTEHQLNSRISYVMHRKPDNNKSNIKDIDILSESYSKKKEKDIIEAEKEQGFNNKYWDKYVSEQMLFEKTHSPKNVEEKYNGISNSNKRFDDIFSFDVDVNKSLDSYKKEMKISKMSQLDIEENLKTADAIIFKIYYDALKDKRKISETENFQIQRISAVKEVLLSQSYASQSYDGAENDKKNILDKTVTFKSKDKKERDTDFHDGSPDVEKPFPSDTDHYNEDEDENEDVKKNI